MLLGGILSVEGAWLSLVTMCRHVVLLFILAFIYKNGISYKSVISIKLKCNICVLDFRICQIVNY